MPKLTIEGCDLNFAANTTTNSPTVKTRRYPCIGNGVVIGEIHILTDHRVSGAFIYRAYGTIGDEGPLCKIPQIICVLSAVFRFPKAELYDPNVLVMHATERCIAWMQDGCLGATLLDMTKAELAKYTTPLETHLKALYLSLLLHHKLTATDKSVLIRGMDIDPQDDPAPGKQSN